MPSGAKKRKAAQKKKDKEANIKSATTPHENDDMKTQESDGGEVSSPVSQDHHNHQKHPFKEEEKRDSSPVRSIVSENTSLEVVHNDGEDTQKVVAEDVGDILVTREMNIEQDSESKDVSVEHVESVKKSHNRSFSSGQSSSSSDDESQVVEKNSMASESGKLKDEADNPVSEGDSLNREVTYVSDNAPSGEDYKFVVETEPIVDSIKLVEPVLEKVIPLTECALLENYDVAELGTEEKEEQLTPSLDENNGPSVTVIDIKSKKIEDLVLPLSSENDGESSSANDVVPKENGDKLLQSLNAPILETSTFEEHMEYSEIPECSLNQPLVAAAPRQVQTTSWKSCCGVFEVLAGSR